MSATPPNKENPEIPPSAGEMTPAETPPRNARKTQSVDVDLDAIARKHAIVKKPKPKSDTMPPMSARATQPVSSEQSDVVKDENPAKAEEPVLDAPTHVATDEPSPPPEHPVADEPIATSAPEIPDSVFLLYPSHSDVIEAEKRRLRLPGVRLVLLLLVPLIVASLTVAFVAYTRWAALPPLTAPPATASVIPPNTLGNAVTWTVWALLANIVTFGLFFSALGEILRHRALERRGQLTVGKVRTATGRIDRWGNMEITVAYQFRAPKRYRWDIPARVEGKRTIDRNDLRGAPLPSPGTPLAVLYHKRDNYVVL